MSAEGTSSGNGKGKAGCFGCSPGNERGLQLAFRRDGDSVVAEASMTSAYEGYEGLVHGGVVATMLDEAMGWALLELAGRYGVTRSLKVEFRRPVTVRRPLTIRARITGGDGTRSVVIEAGVHDDRGRLLASAIGEWAPVRTGRVRPGTRA
ncbi:MAG TPA: PaaI family thioesterase [Candidatus Limnocylindrales bacterium]|nr:PaaI family thioesterase [Candidatus Limnocylindrales bacterium]